MSGAASEPGLRTRALTSLTELAFKLQLIRHLFPQKRMLNIDLFNIFPSIQNFFIDFRK